MTSRVEACPNIALEAMAHGCLCIAADNPPLPEIFEDAAIFYPSRKPEVLAKKIADVFSWLEYRRQNMKEKANARAAQFSWYKCAEQTINEFETTIEQFRHKLPVRR